MKAPDAVLDRVVLGVGVSGSYLGNRIVDASCSLATPAR